MDYGNRCFSYREGRLVAAVQAFVNYDIGRQDYLVSYELGEQNLTILEVIKSGLETEEVADID